MRSVRNMRGIQRTSRRRLRDGFRERLSNRCLALCQENAELTRKLGEEKNNSVSLKKLTIQLRQELAETRDQLDEDMNKLLQDELDRINNEISQRYETDVINARQQVDNLLRELENEVQQHKLLQKDYKEQRVARMFSQENFPAELCAEIEKNRILQEELQKTCVSYYEVSQRYETDVIAVRQQADTLQRELEKEVKSHADTVSAGWRVINNLRAEQDTLRQKMAEEINVLQQNTAERERAYLRELEEQKTQLNVQFSLNHELSTKLTAERSLSLQKSRA